MIKRKNLKNETDKTLVIMFFLESRRNIKHITTKDIAEGYKEVREIPRALILEFKKP